MKKKISLLMLLCIVYLFIYNAVVVIADTTPPGIKLDDIEAQITVLMEEHIGKDVAGAAIAVVKDGEIIFKKGFGYADIENKIAINPDTTVFEYGSASKLFVWVAAMKLKEEGRLDLNADIRTYLPKKFKLNTKYDTPITMLQLMNHMGGFDDYSFNLFNHEKDLVDLRTALERHKEEQIYEPGTIASYSNLGVALAGYVIENIVGKDFYTYLKEQYFEPLGMENSSAHPMLSDNEDIIPKKANGYSYQRDGVFKLGNGTIISMYPAGSINGTIVDLAKFALALLPIEGEKSPLFDNAETLKELFTPTYRADEDVMGICHGFLEYDGQYRGYWHNGGTEYFGTYFMVVPEENFGVVVTSNSINKGLKLCFAATELLCKKQSVVLNEPEENLPSAAKVEGGYINPRRSHHGITQMLYFPGGPDIKIKKVNDQQIMYKEEIYTQIKPYVFQGMESGKKVAFTEKDGKIIKFTDLFDYVPVTITETLRPLFTIASVISFLVSLLFVLAVGIIAKTKGKSRDIEFSRDIRKLNREGALLYSSFLLIFVNIAIAFLRVSADNAISFFDFRLHLVLNCLLAVLVLISMLGIKTVLKRKSVLGMNKVAYICCITAALGLMVTLFWWGFFNIFS